MEKPTNNTALKRVVKEVLPGIKYRYLADATGLTAHVVYALVKGKSQMTPEKADMLAKAINSYGRNLRMVTPDELMEPED